MMRRSRVASGSDRIGFPGPASLKDVHDGTYTVLDWFAEELEHDSITQAESDDGEGHR